MTLLTSAGPHALVDDIDDPQLDDDTQHHLRRVLRLRSGAPFTVGDGAGSWRAMRFGDPPEPTGDPAFEERRSPTLTVFFAPMKGGRTELVVQKLTEIGVDVIAPIVTGRSVVRWDEAKAADQIARLRRVAREASMQSRRAWLPTVEPVGTLDDALAHDGVVLADVGAPSGPIGSSIVVGPEGGWEPDEAAAAPRRVGLGETVLRAETACIVAGSLMVAQRAAGSLPG